MKKWLTVIGTIGMAGQASASVTFAEHIAPLVYDNCTSCHRPGEAGPFSLTNYREVAKRSQLMLEVIEDRYMPPWKPVPGHGKFANDRSLAEEEIAMFKKWVESGRPEGDRSKLPKMPEFPKGWTRGDPDLVVKMTEGFTVPADGKDIYRNFVIPLDLPEDKWVKAVELRPTARSVLHHVLLFLDDSGSARKLDARDGKPGFKQMAFRRSGSLGSYIPGSGPFVLPGDLSLPLKKGSDLVLASHFHPSGKEEFEQSSVGIYFADKPSPQKVIGVQVPPVFGRGMGIDIPAGQAEYKVEDEFTLPVDVVAHVVGGHAHYVCEKMKMTATLPDGKTESLIYIDDWDLNWQGRYFFKKPIELPAGTVLKTELVYNNSVKNPRNPFNPPQRIRWGRESTDEMGSVTLQVVAAKESEARQLEQALRRNTGRKLVAGSRKGRQTSASGVMRLLDKNNDGKVEKSEAPDRLKRSFARLDKDGNGTLEETEIGPVLQFLKNLRQQ